jgi:hypothetical protein
MEQALQMECLSRNSFVDQYCIDWKRCTSLFADSPHLRSDIYKTKRWFSDDHIGSKGTGAC